VLGIVNLPGLLTTLAGDARSLEPARSASRLLGTVATSRHVWSTGPSGNLTSLEDVLKIGRTKGLVFAMNSFTSLGFLTAAIPCAVLGLNAEFVPGYSGSGESMMAAIRGEVDIVSLDRETQLDRVAAGDLRPLFRIAGDDAGWNRPYADLPKLAGSQGLIGGSEQPRTARTPRRWCGSPIHGRAIAAPPGLAGGARASCIAAGRLRHAARPGARPAGVRRPADAGPGLRRRHARPRPVTPAPTSNGLGPLLRAAVAKVRKPEARNGSARSEAAWASLGVLILLAVHPVPHRRHPAVDAVRRAAWASAASP
jgi:hypothetical protein